MTAIRLVGIRDEPLSVDEVLRRGAGPAGRRHLPLRRHDPGRGRRPRRRGARLLGAPERERCAGRRSAPTVAGRHDVIAIAAVHRVGDLVVGDLATVVAASAAHRADAFAAAQDLIDTLKSTVPIWKHQRFADGEAEWVGLP